MPSPREPAYLFDAYPHPRSSHIVVWTKHGDRVRKRLVAYRPHFCIKAEAEPLETAESLLAEDDRVAEVWRDASALWLRGPKEPVLRVRPKRLQDLYAVATDLRKATASKGFLFFDVDHQAESRWMHQEGLFPMCRLQVDDAQGGDGAADRGGLEGAGGGRPDGDGAHQAVDGPRPVLRPARDEDRWSMDFPDPGLRTARLAVEVARSGHAPGFDDPLVAVRLGPQRIECPCPGDEAAEKATLRTLGKWLRQEDPDVLITRHGDRFDIPYLLHRIHALGLQHQVWLGRDVDPHPGHPDQQGKSIHTYGRWLYKTHAYYLRGRWHIDLSKKTLDSEDDRKDLWGILYLARVADRRAQDVNRNGAGYALQQMQIDLACDMGVALPWKRNLAEDWKDAATLCAVDRGGQIMVPRPGIYEDVAACDFSGYYPSLVVRHNLSSDTINCACCPDGPVIPELGYHVCQKNYGHQAEILRRLWPHRRYVKAVLRKAEGGAQGGGRAARVAGETLETGDLWQAP